MTEPVGIKMIIRKHCKQLYANKFDDLDEMDKFFDLSISDSLYPRSLKKKQVCLSRPILIKET